jgi:cytochrome P450
MTTIPHPHVARQAPGPRGAPLIGVLPQVRRDSLGFLTGVFRRYGDVVRYKLGPMTSHLVAHPDAVKYVLQEHVKNFTKDHLSYDMARRIAGNGLVTSQGEFWLRQRRLAQPAFHRQRIAALGQQMVRATEEMLAAWEPRLADGRPVEAGGEMMRLALRIASEALFGTNMQAEAAAVSRSFNTLSEQLVARFRSFNILPPVLPTQADRAWRAAVAELDRVVYGVIAERRRRAEDTGDLLSMLMLARDEETGEQMDDRQLRDEVLTMLLAGHETTATALTWAWAMLDRHPQAAARLHAELDAVLGGRAPTVADVPRLAYTRMVLDETMRLYPPLYVLSRRVREDDEIGGFRIPAGSSVDFSPYVTHRHPAFWDDPERFDPERFTPERVAARHKYAYVPFSTGPRMCIGNSFALLEATLVLATVAQGHRLRVREGHELAASPLLTLRPKGGLPVYLERRGLTAPAV